MHTAAAPSTRVHTHGPVLSSQALSHAVRRQHAKKHCSAKILCGCGRPLAVQCNARLPIFLRPAPHWAMPLRTVLCRARPPKFDTANIGWDVIDNAAMDVGDMKLPQLKAELKARQQVQVGNKAELQVRLTEAREDQGDLKSWIKRLDEEEAWANIESDEGLPSGVASAADQRIYRMFRLERRRQELDEDQKRLYSMVDEQQQQSNALSSADAAELEAIAAAAQRSEEFSVPELRDMISQYQAGNKDKGKQAGRKVAGTAEVSGMGTDQQRASLAGASTQDSPAQDLQSADIEAADPQDLSSYKASELKAELARLSLPVYGSRKQLEERLMNHYETAMQEDNEYEALAQQVEQMSTAELQQQLQARNVDFQGLTKFELQDVLWRYIQVEAGMLPSEDFGIPEDDLGEQLQFSTPAPQPKPTIQDPPTLVALLCGGPLHTQHASLTSAQVVLQQLQTHNPREGFQGDESSPSSDGSAGGPTADSSETIGHSDVRLSGVPLQRRTDLTGLNFVPYFITPDFRAMPITVAELHGKSAATLQFEAAQRQREILSVEQLSQQLKAAADVALSTVQEGPGLAGQLGAALEQVGVPCVGSASQVASKVANKYRCQQRLAELAFPTLPMCELHFSEFAQQGSSQQLEEGSSNQEEGTSRWRRSLDGWMEAHDLTMASDCFVIKPADESHGAGVLLVNGYESLEEHAQLVFRQGLSQSVVVEPYQASTECTEFSVTVIGSSKGPVALLPTEAEAFAMDDDIVEAALEMEAYKARKEGFDQTVIDLFLDVFRSEMAAGGSNGPGQVLLSPFAAQQPASRHLRYHMPARFSKEVVRGIRSAAAKAFEELGLQDIARIDGWVKVERPEPPLPTDLASSSSDEDDHPDSSSAALPASSAAAPPASETEFPDSSSMVTYSHESTSEQQPVEKLSDNVFEYNASPIAMRAVPVLPTEDPAQGVDEIGLLSSDYGIAESAEIEAEAESASKPENSASVSTDTEEDDEGSLLMADVTPNEMCRHGESTIFLSGVHAVPVLEPTSVIFQQAADVGMSHSALLRHVLSRACVRAGLPPIPAPLPQDVTETSLVPYAQVQQEGPEIRLNGATLTTAGAVYANPWRLVSSTPLGRITTTKVPKQQSNTPEGNQGVGQSGPMGGQFGQQWDEQQFAPMQPAYNYGNPDVLSQDYASTSGYLEDYSQEEEVTKVWILMGGEGLQRQLSIKSGLHVWLMLQNNPELQVEPFLLAAPGANLRERDRRKELLRQRTEHLKLGMEDHQLPEQLQLSYIRNPAAPSHPLTGRFVWAVPYSLLLRNKVEDIQAACELTQQSTNTVDRMLSEFEREAATLRRDVQRELKYAEVEGPGLLWGSDPMAQPPPPRLMDLQSFAAEAREAGAVVLNSVQAEVGDNGYLQSYLETKEVQVMHTGSDTQATALCHDKIAMSEHLKTLEVYHISTIPKARLPLDLLFAASSSLEDTESLFQQLRSSLRDTPELCIKPAQGSWGLHAPLPCITCAEDLMLYALALQDRSPSLPEDYLSTPHGPIDLPPPGHQLMVEPFIHVARLVTRAQQQGPPEIQWEGDSRWIAISAALLGEVGRMQVLTPTIMVHPTSPHQATSSQDTASSPGQDPTSTPSGSAQTAEPIAMTPPPTEFLPPDIIAAAKQWMTMAADRLAIAGAAHIDAFVHADKGEIIIIDVHTVPDLSQDSLLLQQALVEQPPVHPNDVLREIVELAQLPTSQEQYDEDPQFDSQLGAEEDADLLESDTDGDESDMSYGQQSFAPSQQNGAPKGDGGGGAWSDDSFTDAALDDNAFDTSGFDVVEQS